MKDFFKYTFASLIGSILGITLIIGVGFGGLIFFVVSIASQTKDVGPQVEDKSILVFDLGTSITDTRPISSTGEALQEVLSSDHLQPSPSEKQLILSMLLPKIKK